jgi:hypothetical protein
MFSIHSIYQPVLSYFRKRRMQKFLMEFQVTPSTRILDVGGEPFNWELIGVNHDTHQKLTFLNLYRMEKPVNNWVIADGRHLPFRSRSFEIVYSNSVIEHLHSYTNQQLFADEVCRVGKSYFIQTPNRNFFIEPHYITPFIHWLPVSVRRKLLRNFTLWGILERPSQQECENRLEEIRLLNEVELIHLFPNAIIWHERLLGMSKSLIAVKMENKFEGRISIHGKTR